MCGQVFHAAGINLADASVRSRWRFDRAMEVVDGQQLDVNRPARGHAGRTARRETDNQEEGENRTAPNT